jgi:hypothetical protein
MRLVYRRPANVALGIVAGALMETFLLWSGQIITIEAGHLWFTPHASYIIASLVIATLFGTLLPMQVEAVRLAAATAFGAGGTAFGALFGTAAMTCCTPVVLPSLLSLVGFSGTSILGINGTLHRFWLPLATLSAIFLIYALVSVARAVEVECRIEGSASNQLTQ